MSDETTRAKVDHDRITNQVLNWPAWPILPMKRTLTGQHGQWPELGVITADYPNIVICLNMFEVNRINLVLHQLSNDGEVEDVKTYKYQDVWAMLDDGWVVD